MGVYAIKTYYECRRSDTALKKKEDPDMSEVKNLDGKRVCDITPDKKIVEIGKKDCITRITANPDGTLKVEHTRKTTAA